MTQSELLHQIEAIARIDIERRKRGIEVERQAAEILELQKRNEMQRETIERLRCELEFWSRGYKS